MVTAGLKWAPDMDLKDEINTKRIRPMEIALAINVTLSLFERLAPIIPEPTMVKSNMKVPRNSKKYFFIFLFINL